jgi:hypothetical protein
VSIAVLLVAVVVSWEISWVVQQTNAHSHALVKVFFIFGWCFVLRLQPKNKGLAKLNIL